MSNEPKKINRTAVGVAVAAITLVGLGLVAKRKKKDSVFENEPEQKNPLEGKIVVFVEDESDSENADGEKGHLEATGEAEPSWGVYDQYVKRGIDICLSFGGLVLLSPVFAATALAIKIEDPGPVLFTQKRVGRNKQFFKLHKFRSMKVSTPHDVPTHMLDNPDQYITKVGKFIRAHSVDELPQIWDIFIGNMAVIGPRPGLWNQDVLTAERDKYGANDIRPGLTGWAQINGRDELEISDKAKFDGEYVENESLAFDAKCFLGTIAKVCYDDSVVEGGTGTISGAGRNFTKGKSDEELIGNIGFGDPVKVDFDQEKTVLIVGAGSYIGESFKSYANENYPLLKIDTVESCGNAWRTTDFSQYDVVFHVAGIAHSDVGNVDDATKEKYYSVNTDLAVDVCKMAKEGGAKEFVFMSSMIVYGDSTPYGKEKIVDEETVPVPANFYGDSKLQADVAVRGLATDEFKVVVLRPPMIYGQGSKGNYPTLAALSRKLPVFPSVDNERSMLHIDNLCEFLCQVMLVQEFHRNSVVLFPQNSEWTNTSDIVRLISEASCRLTIVSGALNPLVSIGSLFPGKVGGLVNKAFGNSVYSHELSAYEGIDYQKLSLKDSVILTEKGQFASNLKIMVVGGYTLTLKWHRMDMMKSFAEAGCDVVALGEAPEDEWNDFFAEIGVRYRSYYTDRNGTNPANDIRMFNDLKRIFQEEKPDKVLVYHTKPNVYGSLAAKACGITEIYAMVGGVGSIFNAQGTKAALVRSVLSAGLRAGLACAKKVFVQNHDDAELLVSSGLLNRDKIVRIDGSGVNTERFAFQPVPEKISFLFVGRLVEGKGVFEYLDAARIVKQNNPKAEFHLVGPFDSNSTSLDEDSLRPYIDDGTIIYHGEQSDVRPFLAACSVFVFPSYYGEGVPKSALEAMSTGRAIIAANAAGSREVVIEGENGFLVSPKSVDELVLAMERFCSNANLAASFGEASRHYAVQRFNVDVVDEVICKTMEL